jgi:hypothetical protein
MKRSTNLLLTTTWQDFSHNNLELSIARILSDYEDNYQLEARLPKFRGIDPSVSVAIIGSAAAVVSTLLTGLLEIAKNAQSRKITIELSDSNRRIEVIGSVSLETINQIANRLVDIGARTAHIKLIESASKDD